MCEVYFFETCPGKSFRTKVFALDSRCHMSFVRLWTQFVHDKGAREFSSLNAIFSTRSAHEGLQKRPDWPWSRRDQRGQFMSRTLFFDFRTRRVWSSLWFMWSRRWSNSFRCFSLERGSSLNSSKWLVQTIFARLDIDIKAVIKYAPKDVNMGLLPPGLTGLHSIFSKYLGEFRKNVVIYIGAWRLLRHHKRLVGPVIEWHPRRQDDDKSFQFAFGPVGSGTKTSYLW